MRDHLGDFATGVLGSMQVVAGRCNCGAVAFEASKLREAVTFCHCSQCRKFSGHYWASTRAAASDVVFSADAGLTWYQSSDHAQRGFCKICGASLFYRPHGADHFGISAGCLDLPTGMTPGKHIFTANRGDYYTLPDDAPHIPD